MLLLQGAAERRPSSAIYHYDDSDAVRLGTNCVYRVTQRLGNCEVVCSSRYTITRHVCVCVHTVVADMHQVYRIKLSSYLTDY